MGKITALHQAALPVYEVPETEVTAYVMEFHEIAQELGISTRRVQQLYVQAMKKLLKADLQLVRELAHESERLRQMTSQKST